MKYLKLIRIPNLLLLALMQISFHFGLLKPQTEILALNDWQFLLLVFATICIAAAGYIINDIQDKDIDQINKPNSCLIPDKISESTAYNLYITLNILGVGAGFYLSNIIERPSFSGIFILIAITLYLYATSLKKTFIISNLIVAVLLALSVLIVGIFDLYPIIVPENQAGLAVLFSILMDYALFALLLNFIREIIKDLQDQEGDRSFGVRSLVNTLGERTTKIIVQLLLLIALSLIGYYVYVYLFNNGLNIATLYGLALIMSPMAYVTFRLFEGATTKDYKQFSGVLKWVILFGILSLYIIQYNKNLL